MDNTYELYRNGGLMTTVHIKDHTYDVVEFTIKQYLKEGDKEIVNNAYTTFYSSRELKEFFTPILNDLKARFDNEQSASESNT